MEILHSDDDILSFLQRDVPEAVGIDAPLSLPPGRRTIDDQNGIHFRSCDLDLRKLGIRFFPITLGPMRRLTERGIRLKKAIEKLDITVIEVYPGATYDQFGLNRKDRESILFWCRRYLNLPQTTYTQDELDGIACALTTLWYVDGKAIVLGKSDGQIMIPDNQKLSPQNS